MNQENTEVLINVDLEDGIKKYGISTYFSTLMQFINSMNEKEFENSLKILDKIITYNTKYANWLFLSKYKKLVSMVYSSNLFKDIGGTRSYKLSICILEQLSGYSLHEQLVTTYLERNLLFHPTICSMLLSKLYLVKPSLSFSIYNGINLSKPELIIFKYFYLISTNIDLKTKIIELNSIINSVNIEYFKELCENRIINYSDLLSLSKKIEDDSYDEDNDNIEEISDWLTDICHQSLLYSIDTKNSYDLVSSEINLHLTTA